MTYDSAVAGVIRARLEVMKVIDDAAELSFLQSARFRLELFDIVKRFDGGKAGAGDAAAALEDLHRRVSAVIASARESQRDLAG